MLVHVTFMNNVYYLGLIIRTSVDCDIEDAMYTISRNGEMYNRVCFIYKIRLIQHRFDQMPGFD